MDEFDRAAYEAAHQAFLAAHPDRNPTDLNNDEVAIEWRHGYVTGYRQSVADNY